MDYLAQIAKWLGLTSQQSTIVSILYTLQERKLPTNPISIEKEYIKETNAFIQKSNLFTQLKILQERGIIHKDAHSHYQLNIGGIQEAISQRKNKVNQEMKEVAQFASDTKAFFEKMAVPTPILVTYLNESELFAKLAFYLRSARGFYLGCDFPHYAYSFALCSSSQEAAYIEALTAKLQDKEFSLFCLSPYKIEALSHRLGRKYKNKDLVEEELKTICKTAAKKTAQCSNIDLRKTGATFDFALIESRDGADSLFMFLKDSESSISGGIFLNSYETIKQIKQHFLSQMGSNQPLKNEKDFPKISETFLISLKNTNLNNSKNKLIAFDVNQVFTVNHTTVDLAKLAGKEKKVGEFITSQIEGELSVDEAIVQSAELLKGLSVDKINLFLPKLPLMKNVRQGIKKLKEAGYYIIAISTGFSHVINPLCESLGADEIYCNALEEKEGKLTGKIIEKNVAIDNVKYYIVKYLLEKYSLAEKDSVGVGDGYSDLDLLKATGLRIAFNPSRKMAELYEKGTPLINHMIKEKDFMVLTKKILEGN